MSCNFWITLGFLLVCLKVKSVLQLYISSFVNLFTTLKLNAVYQYSYFEHISLKETEIPNRSVQSTLVTMCFFYHVSCFTDVKRFFSPDRRLSETCCSSASVVSRLQEMQNCICLQAHRAQSGWRFKSAAAASERGRQRAAASGPDMREGLSAGSQ